MQYMADLIRAGVPPTEAARRARIEFGSVSSTQDECRAARGLQPFDELRRQLRHAARTLRKTPRFTATALLTLAVCLGANLTIFAVVDAILLRPLPFPAPTGWSRCSTPIPKQASSAMAPQRRITTNAAVKYRPSRISPSTARERPSSEIPAQRNACRLCAYRRSFSPPLA